jgi:hypothetical protein
VVPPLGKFFVAVRFPGKTDPPRARGLMGLERHRKGRFLGVDRQPDISNPALDSPSEIVEKVSHK